MAWARVILAAMILAAIIGCKSVEERVVGKWQNEDSTQSVTFHENGTATFEVYGRTTEANYKFTDAAHARFDFDGTFGELEGQQVARVAIEKEELSLEFESGANYSFTRVQG